MKTNLTVEGLCQRYGELVGKLIQILCNKILDIYNPKTILPSLKQTQTNFDNNWKAEIKSISQQMINIEKSKDSPQLNGIHVYCSDHIKSLLSEIDFVNYP